MDEDDSTQYYQSKETTQWLMPGLFADQLVIARNRKLAETELFPTVFRMDSASVNISPRINRMFD